MTVANRAYEGRLPRDGAVRITVSGGTIAAVEPRPDDPALPWALPVLVDLQHNGALGSFYTFMDEPGLEVLPAIMRHIRRHGVEARRVIAASGNILRARRLIIYEPARLTYGSPKTTALAVETFARR